MKNFEFRKVEVKNEELDIKKIFELIMFKRNEYCQKYYLMPKYIKMPYWLYQVLYTQVQFDVKIYNAQMFLFNMLVCETQSINSIEEIEVF